MGFPAALPSVPAVHVVIRNVAVKIVAVQIITVVPFTFLLCCSLNLPGQFMET